MVRRILAPAVMAIALAGCASVPMSADEAVESTAAALETAQIDASEIVVTASGRETYTVSASTSAGDLTLEMDADAGRITAVDVGAGVTLTPDQLDDLARHRDNPAADRARGRRIVTAAVVSVAVVAVALALARRARIREESARP